MVVPSFANLSAKGICCFVGDQEGDWSNGQIAQICSHISVGVT